MTEFVPLNGLRLNVHSLYLLVWSRQKDAPPPPATWGSHILKSSHETINYIDLIKELSPQGARTLIQLGDN
jgi:hypothetical protein